MTSKKIVPSDLAARIEALHGPILSLKRAAKIAGYSERTLWRAIASGALASSNPGGGRVLVTTRDLAAWVASRR